MGKGPACARKLTFRAVKDHLDQLITHAIEARQAYHCVALPNNDMPRILDSFNMSRQELFDLVCAVSTDESDFSWNIIRVDD